MRVGIVDYGAGNLTSLGFALDELGIAHARIQEPPHEHDFDAILIPGVGSFSFARRRLDKTGLYEFIQTFAEQGGRLVGVCLGMQLLLEQSEEGGLSSGLGLIPGKVVASAKIPNAELNRIGWDHVRMDIELDLSGDYFFAHSFEATGVPQEYLAGLAHRGGREVVAAIMRGNVVGMQFHPEKSGLRGLRALDWALRDS